MQIVWAEGTSSRSQLRRWRSSVPRTRPLIFQEQRCSVLRVECRARYEIWAAAVDLVWLERVIRQRWLGCATCVRYGDGAPISHRVGNRPRLVHRRSMARPGTQSSTVSSHFHELNIVGNLHPHGLHVAVGTGLRDMVSARSSLGSDRHGTSIRRKVASIFCSATFNRTVLVTKFRLSMEGCGLLLKHR